MNHCQTPRRDPTFIARHPPEGSLTRTRASCAITPYVYAVHTLTMASTTYKKQSVPAVPGVAVVRLGPVLVNRQLSRVELIPVYGGLDGGLKGGRLALAAALHADQPVSHFSPALHQEPTGCATPPGPVTVVTVVTPATPPAVLEERHMFFRALMGFGKGHMGHRGHARGTRGWSGRPCRVPHIWPATSTDVTAPYQAASTRRDVLQQLPRPTTTVSPVL
jgi:hypothetical protein